VSDSRVRDGLSWAERGTTDRQSIGRFATSCGRHATFEAADG
jgi:hypothetical protein